MRTVQQILGFVQGWEHAIGCNDEELDKDNIVYQTLVKIETYIKSED